MLGSLVRLVAIVALGLAFAWLVAHNEASVQAHPGAWFAGLALVALVAHALYRSPS